MYDDIVNGLLGRNFPGQLPQQATSRMQSRLPQPPTAVAPATPAVAPATPAVAPATPAVATPGPQPIAPERTPLRGFTPGQGLPTQAQATLPAQAMGGARPQAMPTQARVAPQAMNATLPTQARRRF